uniref:Uncharacterized protein n=1 Tax=Anguilla anguilla TaxID=7936 RepID=A0A0E9VX00_ANGAN
MAGKVASPVFSPQTGTPILLKPV